MKTGIDEIIIERREQQQKHGRSIERDVEENSSGELAVVATVLADINPESDNIPANWQSDICDKMIRKPYRERLIIAGALIAAEIDRLNYSVKPDKFEVWDYVVTKAGVTRQITNDDMADLPYENIARRATPNEIKIYQYRNSK